MTSLLWLYSILFSFYSFSYSLDIRVMTFDTWHSGREVTNGTQKIAEHIALMDPDIVTLQELNAKTAEEIVTLLPGSWEFVYDAGSYLAILTKHKFSADSSSSTSASKHVLVELSDEVKINVWSFKGDSMPSYGPSTAYDKRLFKPEQLLAEERSRIENTLDVVNSESMKSAVQSVDTVPIILAGTFNSPSHEDWIEETRDLHGGWTFEWPMTKILVDKLGMTDSFRYLNKHVLAVPGITWSLVDSQEPQDRICFIFYRGPLVPLISRIYSGKEPIGVLSEHSDNDWPSDHAAVVTDFRYGTV